MSLVASQVLAHPTGSLRGIERRGRASRRQTWPKRHRHTLRPTA